MWGHMGPRWGPRRKQYYVAPPCSCKIVTSSTRLPAAKPYKLADGLGLYLLVQPSGAKLWRLKYRCHGIERKLSLGQYPKTNLKMARQKCREAREKIADGEDPVDLKRQAQLQAKISMASTFQAVANEYIDKMALEGRTPATVVKARWFLRLLDMRIGHRPVSEITAHELLAALRAIEARGHRETAHRLRSFASRVFRYAVVTLRAETNPADILRGALVAPRVTHRAAIVDPREVGALLRAIEDYTGHIETRIALQLAPHVFVRPSDEDLADLRRRILATRWPEQETVADDTQGVRLATAQKLAHYWANDYDWCKCEARLNALHRGFAGRPRRLVPRPRSAELSNDCARFRR